MIAMDSNISARSNGFDKDTSASSLVDALKDAVNLFGLDISFNRLNSSALQASGGNGPGGVACALGRAALGTFLLRRRRAALKLRRQYATSQAPQLAPASVSRLAEGLKAQLAATPSWLVWSESRSVGMQLARLTETGCTQLLGLSD